MKQENAERCLLCGGQLSTEIANIYDTRFGIQTSYSIASCSTCGSAQTAPLPTPQELKNLYETYYNFGGESGTRYTHLRERFLFSLLYRYWLALDGDISFQNRKGNGRLLDVGCNEGRGLRFYAKNGYVVEGLELNETAAEAARAQGYTVHTVLLEAYRPSEKYEVVVLSNVLEHSLDPKQMLKHIRDILAPSGQVWISCPNSRSWLRSVFGKYWINWHVPFHIAHFSENSLRKVLRDIGFSRIKVKHETPALWAAHSVLARFFSKRGKPTRQLRNPLLVIVLMLLWRGLLFPFLWIGDRVRRGDCIVVTATKE
jgi:2-polyprenyl-3-methyl-5-hydroxy-6-metoxy-1,4-benzoquinol methylase